MSGPNVPRWRQAREVGVDYFDESFRAEQEGLGGTEAAELTRTVREVVTPDGLNLTYHCNCGQPISVTVSWSELAAIAHRVSPQKAGVSNDQWAEVRTQGGFAPVIQCKNGCPPNKSTQPVVQFTEAAKRLQQGMANGFVGPQTDPAWPRAMQVFPSLR